MTKKLLALLLVLAGSATWAGSANVESVSTGLLNRAEIKVGDDAYAAVNFKLVVVVNKSSFGLFKAGDILTAACVGANQNVNGKSTVQGNCILKDASGDSYTTTYERIGTMGNPGAGKQTIKGLTGKFIGMTGSCTYDAKYAQNDGLYVISFASCDYKN